jgi:hypothetical protein
LSHNFSRTRLPESIADVQLDILINERQLGRRLGSQLVTLPDRPSSSATTLPRHHRG